MAPVELICQFCRKPFTVPAYISSKRVCCSRACLGQLKSNHPGNVWTEFQCENCGVLARKRTYRMNAGSHKFCSKKCHHEWATKQTPLYWRTLTCVICSVEFKRSRYFVETRGDAKCCSRQCLNKYNSIIKQREKNVNWNGGSQTKDYGPNWFWQKKQARKRDSFRCVLCHVQPHVWKLDVHHITAFKTFGWVPGENENYLQANDLANLITLCRTCHRKVEKKPHLLHWVAPRSGLGGQVVGLRYFTVAKI
jgi:hypothetical protein